MEPARDQRRGGQHREQHEQDLDRGGHGGWSCPKKAAASTVIGSGRDPGDAANISQIALAAMFTGSATSAALKMKGTTPWPNTVRPTGLRPTGSRETSAHT